MPWKLHFAKKWHLRLDFDELCYGCTDHIMWGSCRERSGKDMNSLGSRCGYSPWMWSCNPICGEGNGTSLQYSCLENPMDGGALWAIVHRVAKSQTGLNGLRTHEHTHIQYSCLRNPMDRGACQAMVPGVTELDMTERLRLSHFPSHFLHS